MKALPLMIRLSTTLVAGMVLVGCTGSASDTHSANRSGINAVWTVDTTPLVVVGDPAAADTNSLLVRDLTFLNADVLAVTDASTQRLLLIDSTGMVAAMGRSGDGPGEFRAIHRAFACPGDTIMTWDTAQRRTSYWTLAGSFVRTSTVLHGPGRASEVIGASPDCQSLLIRTWDPASRSPQQATRLRSALVRMDVTGGALDTLMVYGGTLIEPLRGGAAAQFGPVLFASTPVSASMGTRILFGDGERSALQWLDWSGRHTGTLSWTEERQAVQANDVARVTQQRDSLRHLHPDQAKYIPSIESHTIADRLPLYDAVIAGDNGAVWVRHYRLTDDGLNADVDPRPERWRVFDADGSYRGDVDMPRRFSLRAIRGGRAAGTHLDSDDVQSMRMHRIRAR